MCNMKKCLNCGSRFNFWNIDKADGHITCNECGARNKVTPMLAVFDSSAYLLTPIFMTILYVVFDNIAWIFLPMLFLGIYLVVRFFLFDVDYFEIDDCKTRKLE